MPHRSVITLSCEHTLKRRIRDDESIWHWLTDLNQPGEIPRLAADRPLVECRRERDDKASRVAGRSSRIVWIHAGLAFAPVTHIATLNSQWSTGPIARMSSQVHHDVGTARLTALSIPIPESRRSIAN